MINSDTNQFTSAAGLIRGQGYALDHLPHSRRWTFPISQNLLPISSVLLACFLFGASIIFAKLTFGRVPVSQVVLWRFIFASLPMTVWASLLGQGVLCTALAYCLWNFGISRLVASQVGIYANLEPVIGVTLGVLVLKEGLTAATLLGGLLVIGAAIFV